MNSAERVITALKGDIPDRIPFIELEVDEILARRILGINHGEMTIPETGLYERSIKEEKELAKILNKDNICYSIRAPLFCDKMEGKDGRIFYGSGHIKSRDKLDLLKELPDPGKEDFYDGAKRFVAKKEDFAACAVGRLGIASTYMSMGFENFALAIYDDPWLVQEVLKIYTDWMAEIVNRISDLGFDFIWAADDIAYKTGPIFSPKIYSEMILPHLRKVVENIRLPWIYHSDGNLMPIMEDWLSLGMNGIHPIEPEAMDIEEVKRFYGDRVCIVGNIDISILTMGTQKEVEEQVKRRIEALACGGGYIVSSSNSITSYCKPENVIAMSRAIQKYGSYVQQL